VAWNIHITLVLQKDNGETLTIERDVVANIRSGLDYENIGSKIDNWRNKITYPNYSLTVQVGAEV
jgi:hypothetical protein